MAKNLKWIIIAAVIVVLIIIGATFALISNKSGIAPKVSITKENQTPESSAATDSIKNLLAAGKNQKCEIAYPENKGKGIIYVSGNKFAGDYTVEGPQGTIAGHSISDGVYVYNWSSMSTDGVKIKIDQAEKNTATNSEDQQNFDINQQVSLKCSSWNTDNSKFNVPTNIKFTDVSSLLNNPVVTGTMEDNAKASPCDQLPSGAAKDTCVKALQDSQ